MSRVVISTRPVRAEQYRTGMKEILGRDVIQCRTPYGTHQFAPFAPKDSLNDGDWLVEVGPLYLNKSGKVDLYGIAVRVVPDGEYQAEFRPASGEDLSKFVEAQRRAQAERQTRRLAEEAIARAKALPSPEEVTEGGSSDGNGR